MASLLATAHPDIAAVDVVLDTTIGRDTFSRSVSNGWGTTDTGQSWTVDAAPASDYSTNGSSGIITLSATNSERRVVLNSGTVNHRVRVTNLLAVTPTGAGINWGILLRHVDASNYIWADVQVGTDGSLTLRVVKRVAGILSQVATKTVAVTHSTSVGRTLTAEVYGSTVSLRVYAASAGEPLLWQLSTTVGDAALQTGTNVGAIARLMTGNTNPTPVTLTFDNLRVSAPCDAWHVWRVHPDASVTELLGSPVYPSNGLAVLWDTVAPLDTPVSYGAGCELGTPLLTSNTVTVTGAGQGWLKDPAQPVNDIRLDTCPTRTCPNTSEGVSFLALGQGQFASATGVFPIIDTARPRTVAMTRKARTSVLTLLSHSIADGLRLEDILASGRNLFLTLASRYGWAARTYHSDYIAVGDATEDRPGTANQTYPDRTWSLPFAVGRPPYVPSHRVGGNGIGVNGATYGDATATGRTYAQRTATGNTYLDSSRGVGL